MDKVPVFGTGDGGSIPSRGTRKETGVRIFSFLTIGALRVKLILRLKK